MKRRTKADWHTLFTEHKQSGLTATAFCLERNINPKYFSLRRQQLQTKEQTKSSSPFIPVDISTLNTSSMVELQLNESLMLKIPLSVSPSWLVGLLQQLQD